MKRKTPELLFFTLFCMQVFLAIQDAAAITYYSYSKPVYAYASSLPITFTNMSSQWKPYKPTTSTPITQVPRYSNVVALACVEIPSDSTVDCLVNMQSCQHAGTMYYDVYREDPRSNSASDNHVLNNLKLGYVAAANNQVYTNVLPPSGISKGQSCWVRIRYEANSSATVGSTYTAKFNLTFRRTGDTGSLAPTTVNATAYLTNGIQVKWSGGSGASSYNLWRGTSSSPGNASRIAEGVKSPHLDDSPELVVGIKYYYWIEAVKSGKSEFSKSDWGVKGVSVKLDSAETPVPASGGDKSFSVAANTSWSAASDADWIRFSDSSGDGDGTCRFTVLANSGTCRTGMVMVTAGAGTVYPQSASNKVVQAAATGAVPKPGAPTGLGATTNRTDGIQVSWTGGSDATSHNVWRGTTTARSDAERIKIGATSPYPDTSSDLVAGKSYYYWIEATNSAGFTFSSSYVTGKKVLAKPGAPTGLGATKDRTDGIRVSWSGGSDATSHNVWRGTTTARGDATRIKIGATSPYPDTSSELVAGKSYYYWIEATNSAGYTFSTSYATGKKVAEEEEDKDWTYTIANGKATVTGGPANGIISIPSSLGGCPVTAVGTNAFSKSAKLESVTIPNSVTNIGFCAFYGCTRLADVAIPDSVTSIGDYAFFSCSNLACMTIPDGVTHIGFNAFNACSGLKNLALPNSIIDIDTAAFEYCSGLTNVTIPSSMTRIESAVFSCCRGLTSVTIPDSVTNIGVSAFYGCNGLTNLTIPDSVTSIESGAFEGCSGLTSVTIPDSVTRIGGNAFSHSLYDTNTLAGVCLVDGWVIGWTNPFPSSLKLTGVRGIALGAFSGCSTLTSVTIPDSMTRIGNSAFSSFSGLTHVTIPDSVTSIGHSAFFQCSALTSVMIPGSVTNIENHAFNGCSSLTNVTISDGVTRIGNYAFRDCSLTSVKFPASVTSLGEGVFYDCNTLSTLHVPSTWEGTDMLAEAYVPSTCTIVYYTPETNLRQKVAFDPNGGSCGTRTKYYPVGGYYTNLPAATREGWTFTGWYTATNGGTKVTAGTVVSAEATRTLFAQWTENGKPNLVFYKRKGWPAPVFLSTERDCLEARTVFSTTDTLYLFCCYSNKGTEEAAPHGVRASVTDTDAAERFWTHEYNGGSLQTNWNSAWSNTLVSVSLAPGNYLLRVELDHTGALDELDESDNLYQTEFTVALSTQTVSFDANGGTCTTGTKTYPQGGCYMNLPEATRPGHAFNGWYTATNGGTRVAAETPVTAEAERTLYAQWTENGKPNLVFKKRKGWPAPVFLSTERDCLEARTVFSTTDTLYLFCCYSNKGTEEAAPHGVRMSVTDTDAAERFWTFEHNGNSLQTNWNRTWSNKTVSVSLAPGNYLLRVELDYTGALDELDESDNLYQTEFAVTVPTQTVSFDANGGTCTTGTKTYPQGGCYTNLPEATRPGHAFNGWYTATNGGTQVTAKTTVTAEAERTLYAQWTADETDWTYTVSFGSATVTGGPTTGSISVPDTLGGYPVTGIGHAVFQGCTGLTEVAIPPGMTDIADDAFEGCSGLRAVHIRDLAAWCRISFGIGIGNPLKCARHLYLDGKEITNLVVPSGIDSLKFSVFHGCIGLTNAVVPAGVESIGWAAFCSCSALRSVTLPAGLARIASYAFADCTELVSLALPPSVTDIGYYAFQNCSGLVTLSLPDSVTTLEFDVFSGCSGLKTLYVPGSWKGTEMLADAGVPDTCKVVYRNWTQEEATWQSPVPVAHDWLENHAPEILGACGGDHEAAALAEAANGMRVWECYLAGLDPTDERAEFKVKSISIADGEATVEWTPDLNDNGTKTERRYVVEGKQSMEDEWGEKKPGSHFFRVRVEMPQE